MALSKIASNNPTLGTKLKVFFFFFFFFFWARLLAKTDERGGGRSITGLHEAADRLHETH
jgi:hypothetical protein